MLGYVKLSKYYGCLFYKILAPRGSKYLLSVKNPQIKKQKGFSHIKTIAAGRTC